MAELLKSGREPWVDYGKGGGGSPIGEELAPAGGVNHSMYRDTTPAISDSFLRFAPRSYDALRLHFFAGTSAATEPR
jgi:hypothetical protein